MSAAYTSTRHLKVTGGELRIYGFGEIGSYKSGVISSGHFLFKIEEPDLQPLIQTLQNLRADIDRLNALEPQS